MCGGRESVFVSMGNRTARSRDIEAYALRSIWTTPLRGSLPQAHIGVSGLEECLGVSFIFHGDQYFVATGLG